MKVRSNITNRVITLGQEFEVHAIAFWDNGRVNLCVVPESIGGYKNHRIRWWSSISFTIIDPFMPHDWKCYLFPNERIRMIIGPSFISESKESLGRLIEDDPDQIAKFFDRLNRLRELSSE